MAVSIVFKCYDLVFLFSFVHSIRDENGLGASSSFDQDVEKVPLDAESDSLDYGDDDASKFNEDGSFIGQYGRGEKANDPGNSSSIV